MRLFNTTTYEIEEFFDVIPRYAILSHTWEGKELSYQDLRGRPSKDLELLPAFDKISRCYLMARIIDLQWAWIDTCCIDKSSSAELSEAINSMFEWYAQAQVCFAYLSDVDLDFMKEESTARDVFTNARWFTRGWTLQELIAPLQIRFYDRSWRIIGERDERRLGGWIALATGIRTIRHWKSASVASKFSWAARRQTTRREDQAYSLMGLFGVNMPLLYGEGTRAFHRLQLEILRQSDDESIFAWCDESRSYTGLLASSVTAFKHSGVVGKLTLPLDVDSSTGFFDRPPYSMTNRGIHLPAIASWWPSDAYDYVRPESSLELVTIPLLCGTGLGRATTASQICVYLYRPSLLVNQWVRVYADRISCLTRAQLKSIKAEGGGSLTDFYINASSVPAGEGYPVGLILNLESVTTPETYDGFHYSRYVFDPVRPLISVPLITVYSSQTRINLRPGRSMSFAMAIIFAHGTRPNVIVLVLSGDSGGLVMNMQFLRIPSHDLHTTNPRYSVIQHYLDRNLRQEHTIGPRSQSVSLEDDERLLTASHAIADKDTWDSSMPPRYHDITLGSRRLVTGPRGLEIR